MIPVTKSRCLPVRLSRLTLVIFFLLAGGTLPLHSQNTLKPAHVAELIIVSSVALSPDGHQIAYTLSVPRKLFGDPNGPAWTELHVVDRQGNSRPFVVGHVNVGSIDWTPDGRAISFLARREGDKFRSLYAIPLAGGEARRVLTHGSNISAYSWSPDGKRVAFLATEPDPSAKEEERLQEQGFNQQVFEEEDRFTRVWVADLEKPDEPARMLELNGNASELHWSPVDNRLAVALAPTPFIDDHYLHRKGHIVDADSGEVLVRIDHNAKLGQIAWSPDGEQIALLAGADLNDPGNGFPFVIPSAGGALRNLLPDLPGHIEQLHWRSNSSLLFLAAEGLWSSVGEIRSDGTVVSHNVLQGQPVFTSMSFSRQGDSAAFVGQTSSHPPEVFFEASRAASPARVTNSNPWLDTVRLAGQQPVRYRARDGLEIEGILIRPLDYEAGARYPLIVQVHGGPESHYSNGWLTSYSMPGQVAAARGFAIFYPNYRASTGRGLEFSKMDHKDTAGKEFDDIVDGVDHLIETGVADRDRVGVIGASYGGYATAWMSTYYSERFAAGVMIAGISDQISKWGVTDTPQENFYSHMEQWPYEQWLFFLKRSPVYYAHQNRTPLLILHGTEDRRVPTGQAFEIYRHIKTRGKGPVRLVTYPGEAHGNRRAAGRFDANLRALRWLEHYLKGPGGDPPAYEIDYKSALN